MNYYQLKRQEDYDEWDNFIKHCPKGHYAQLSSYLKSFRAYGADFKIIVAKDEKIVAGVGLLIFGKGPFKLVSLPMGPVIEEGYEDIFEDILIQAVNLAKDIKAFLFQLQIPYSKQYTHPYLYSKITLPKEIGFQEGFPFKVGSIVNQFFMIDLDIAETEDRWEESMLKTLNSKTRRDIRKSERNGLQLYEAKTKMEIKEAYELMIENGITQGYATRSWEEFAPTILEQVKTKQAVILTVRKDETLLGVHYGVIAGDSYNYIMGGTRRISKDYLVGHFLHWNVLKKARALKLKTYDFTSTGSPGVYKFKMGFKPKQYIFDTPYFYVLSKNKFMIFDKLFPFIKRHKKKIAQFSSLFINKNKQRKL